MPALPDNRVHQGYWVDYSVNKVQGATLTVRSSTGTVIVSFLTVLVTLAGVWWWELVSLAIFLITCQAQHAQAAIVHQRQILLRNLISPASFLLESTIALRANSRKGPRNIANHLIIPISIAAISSLGFIAAGIFTSQVVSTNGIQVLADSDRCGLPYFPQGNPPPGQLYLGTFNDVMITEAWEYSQTCYATGYSLPACNIYSQATIGLSMVSEGTAPFPQASLQSTRTLSLDSGPINSNSQLGINGQKDDQITLRLKFTCSILDGARYMRTADAGTFVRTPDGPPESSLVGDLFAWNFGTANNNFSVQNNVTTAISSNSIQYSTGYFFDQFSSYIGDNTTDFARFGNFVPISELQLPDGDTILIQVASNSIKNMNPVDDPLFSAHQNQTILVGYPDASLIDVYGSDNVSSWVGCKQQYQMCLAQGPCTSLNGFNPMVSEALSLARTSTHNASIFRMSFIMGTFTELGGLGQPPLQAAKLVNGDISQPLPSNQWEMEVQSWFNFTLASLQTKLPYYAMGYDLAVPALGNQTATEDNSPGFCNVQKMRAPVGFSNVSVLGLGIIVGFSGLLFLINSLLVPIAHILERRRILNLPRLRSWDQAGMLQLHRKLYEVLGYTDWDLTVRSAPVYMKDEDLPPLPDYFGKGPMQTPT